MNKIRQDNFSDRVFIYFHYLGLISLRDAIRIAVEITAPILKLVLVGGVVGYWLIKRWHKQPQLNNMIVAITGCDSGVGYSIAHHCYNKGFTVVAMVLSGQSSGAQLLMKKGESTGRLKVIETDVTKPEQVMSAAQEVTDLLNNNISLVFHALVNNAGVMVFAESEWQTERIVSLQLDVNLAGSIRVANTFAPLLRKHKGRVINMCSHCSSLPLPGLAVYAASKAGLQAWSDALRVEWAKYGITVISMVPGAFFQQTNILRHQAVYAEEMQKAMTAEAASYYGQYYNQYQQYLSGLSGEKQPVPVQSRKLYQILDSALLDLHPQAHYHDTPWRYWFYRSLARISPIRLRDWLVTRFTAMPQFKP